MFVFKGQRKLNLKIWFKNIFKIEAFFSILKLYLPHGSINQDLVNNIHHLLNVSENTVKLSNLLRTIEVRLSIR